MEADRGSQKAYYTRLLWGCEYLGLLENEVPTKLACPQGLFCIGLGGGASHKYSYSTPGHLFRSGRFE